MCAIEVLACIFAITEHGRGGKNHDKTVVKDTEKQIKL